MNVPLEDRPAEQVKEEVIDTLIHNFSVGVISNEAFERRLDAVMNATTNQARIDQAKDLTPPPDNTIKDQKAKQFSVNYAHDTAEAPDKLINILGSTDRSGMWKVPKVINVYTFLGSSTLDFTDARFTTPNVTVRVYSVLGSDTVYVPEEVNIISKAFCILGSTENKAPSISSNQSPTVTIEGYVVLSDLSIKIKTTIKEKFVAFANQMKAMFNENGY